MSDQNAVWYVLKGDEEVGPLSRVDIGVEARLGGINGQSQVWREGWSAWRAAADVPDLASLFAKKKFVPSSMKPPPPPAAAKQKGMGLSSFDTAHFKLADLAAEEEVKGSDKGLGKMEFDTAHFKLADLDSGDNGKKRDLEFDTAHFRLADLDSEKGQRNLDYVPDEGPKRKPFRIEPTATPTPPTNPPRAGKGRGTAAAAPASVPAAAPKRQSAPPLETPALPSASAVAKPRAKSAPPPVKEAAPPVKQAPPPPLELDLPVAKQRPVSQKGRPASHDLFGSGGNDEVTVKNARDLSKWAAAEISSENEPVVPRKKRDLPPPPIAAFKKPKPKKTLPLWVIISALSAVAGLVGFLLWD